MGLLSIQTSFEKSGVPQTGLSVTIDIWNADTQLIDITAAAVTEVAGGTYVYDFATFDNDVNYTFRFDGGVALPSGVRYTYGGYSNLDKFDDIESQLNAIASQISALSSGGGSSITVVNNTSNKILTELRRMAALQLPSPKRPGSKGPNVG